MDPIRLPHFKSAKDCRHFSFHLLLPEELPGGREADGQKVSDEQIKEFILEEIAGGAYN